MSFLALVLDIGNTSLHLLSCSLAGTHVLFHQQWAHSTYICSTRQTDQRVPSTYLGLIGQGLSVAF